MIPNDNNRIGESIGIVNHNTNKDDEFNKLLMSGFNLKPSDPKNGGNSEYDVFLIGSDKFGNGFKPRYTEEKKKKSDML